MPKSKDSSLYTIQVSLDSADVRPVEEYTGVIRKIEEDGSVLFDYRIPRTQRWARSLVPHSELVCAYKATDSEGKQDVVVRYATGHIYDTYANISKVKVLPSGMVRAVDTDGGSYCFRPTGIFITKEIGSGAKKTTKRRARPANTVSE
jgi:hypothetical protein